MIDKEKAMADALVYLKSELSGQPSSECFLISELFACISEMKEEQKRIVDYLDEVVDLLKKHHIRLGDLEKNKGDSDTEELIQIAARRNRGN